MRFNLRGFCRSAAALALAVFALPLAAAELRLAATHTLQDSGLLNVLIPAFEASSGIKLRMAVGGTGQVIKLAANGDVDAVIAHVKAQEEQLVASGAGLRRYAIASNDFLIAGPPQDPARVRGTRDAAEAMRRIMPQRRGSSPAATNPERMSRSASCGAPPEWSQGGRATCPRAWAWAGR